jgi:hypothetical protein
MDSRYFNGFVMPPVNHSWAARVLNMQINPNDGPDLTDGNKFVEAKFGVNPENWTILEEQVEYGNNGKPCFLLLAIYKLSGKISEIETTDQTALEKMVLERDGFLVPWNYILSLTCHPGKCNTYRYPRRKDLKIESTYKVEKGQIHLTSGIPEGVFNINAL